MPPPDSPREVHAAGAVVTRKGGDVLLVHRSRYQDWSFPKGKLDRGEHRLAAAVREVHEETGLTVSLGLPLTTLHYPVGGRPKTVHYWLGRVVGDRDDVSDHSRDGEIDAVEWVPWEEAMTRVSYAHDRRLLEEAGPIRKRTRALVVLRHGSARERRSWRRDDRLRPLVSEGRDQARRLVPLLAAYDATALLSSSSTRCIETVTPYADLIGAKVRTDDGLSEEDATAKSVTAAVDRMLTEGEPGVLCSHRPVLPSVFDALGIEPVKLEPASFVVVHHRKGRVMGAETVSLR